MTKELRITVFGSSRPREGDPDYEEARELGRALAESEYGVCSGGYAGVMEAVSRGAKEAGGKTYGVTAEFFQAQVNPWIDEEVRVGTWQERLFELIRMADGFVACKGGTGTLVELAVVWEMLNKSVMQGKPFAVLGDFWADSRAGTRSGGGAPGTVGRSERQAGAFGGDAGGRGEAFERPVEVNRR